jgi:putrescine aminotransferase
MASPAASSPDVLPGADGAPGADVTARAAALRDYERHVSRGTARLAQQVGLPLEVRSEGTRVWDETGRAYLDCGGYGVFILGHRHPRVVAAMHAQLDRHPLATRSLLSPELAAAARRLAATTPDGLDYVYFGSSGAEAVETAIKLARANGRRRLIGMAGGYHGKTMGALSITSRPVFQRPFQPLLPDVQTVPFGDVPALEAALADGPGRACVVVEPVQGEGGVVVPPAGYLAAVAQACRAAGALLVVDEIQTGLGRLGAWWGCAAEGVTPDILLAGKALGGGCMPVSAVVATEEVYAPLNRTPRLHTSTFAGNPLAMAAVHAALDAIEDEGVVARAAALGDRLRARIDAVVPAGGEVVRDVRGRGLLLGLELAHPRLAGALTAELLRHGVVVASPLGAASVVRISPPAILSDADVDWLVDALESALGYLAENAEHPETSG